MSIINLESIFKTYGKGDAKVQALKNVDLAIDKGEITAIMGPSGSGKSTLLNILGCLDTPTLGNYYLNGENIVSFSKKGLANVRNRTFGFVVQYFALLDDHTVYENVKIPLEYSKVKPKDTKEKVMNVLKMLGIEEKKNKYPTELSGGQNQRVAIARALVNNPDIILADEPTGALDKKTGQEVMEILKTLNNHGKTILIVTHDDNIANKCNRIVRIEDGMIQE